MKKILAVLIAALMICLSVVPAMAAGVASGGLDSLGLVQYAIKTFGEASSRIHEAYADTIQKAMDYRKYYNEQGLARAYDKMQVSMRNTGAPSYKSVLNTTNNTFYDMSRDYTYTYNTAYYNNTYNSYYIPVTYNDVDYNYFITYAPTYTNITYIVDGCNDPSQAVSNNYYFQLPDGRNSYNLTADDVFGIPLVGEVINYDAIPENDNCVALYHFDGNLVDASGKGGSITFDSGFADSYVSQSAFGKYLYIKGGGEARKFSVNFSETPLQSDFTVEFRIQFSAPTPFLMTSDDVVSRGSCQSSDALIYTTPTATYTIKESGFGQAQEGYAKFKIPKAGFKVSKTFFTLGSFTSLGLSSPLVSAHDAWYEQVAASPWEAQFWDINNVQYGYDAAMLVKRTMLGNIVSWVKSQDPALAASYTLNNMLSGNWYSIAISYSGATGKYQYYLNGSLMGIFEPASSPAETAITSLTFDIPVDYFAYCMIDELRISNAALYTEDYTPASAPFDLPNVLVLPTVGDSDFGTIAIKSFVDVADYRIGGVRPSYPAQGDVYISLDADKKVTSCQQYQSGTWTECQGSVCDNDTWVDLSEYSFAGQVVNEDDFAEVVDKKEDPAAGTDANPEAEATSFTVHYYKEGTTAKVRRDTVYQNLAVGAAFTASAPTVKGYKSLSTSAEITITADGEHVFYYAVDASSGGGSGGADDPSKPGFFDGLLSSVKSLVNVICGFVGGVVQSLLSGITGIISTLIDAFKAVLSLGGHFGDFLAAALGFVPREIIDLLIAGIAVSIALAIIKFIRG